MLEADALVLIYTTFAGPAEAEEAGAGLIDQRLAACVNIIPGMTSIYEWEGRRERSSETVMVIKTRAALAEAVIAAVTRVHSYSNPAIVVLPVMTGAPRYLDWLRAQTTAAKPSND